MDEMTLNDIFFERRELKSHNENKEFLKFTHKYFSESYSSNYFQQILFFAFEENILYKIDLIGIVFPLLWPSLQ